MVEPVFHAPALAWRTLRESLSGDVTRFTFAWERENGAVYRMSMPVPWEPDAAIVRLAERAVKFVLWAAGGWRLRLAGPPSICRAIENAYAPGGDRTFDRALMTTVYEQPMHIEQCAQDAIPETRDTERGTGINRHGCRLGFDLGASDFKIAAVQDGVVRFNAEFPWDPKSATDPSYHYDLLNARLQQAAATLPRVDALGGSTAGVVVNNRMRVASLFRSIPPDRYAEAQSLFVRLEQEWGVPVTVLNDGDVTALAAFLTEGTTAVLGVAMGSSEAVGYLDRRGRVTGRLNELAFAPVDLSPEAPVDEWSGDRGVGATYFSQQAVNRLACWYGLSYPDDMPLPERLVDVQQRMERGEPVAERIYRTIGTHFGHAVAWYRVFYDFDHVLALGRVTTGAGGEILLEAARAALQRNGREFEGLRLAMPDEKAKRLGQSVAAAMLGAATA